MMTAKSTAAVALAVAVGVTTLSLAAGYALVGVPAASALVLLLGLFWWWGQRRGLAWASHLGLLVFVAVQLLIVSFLPPLLPLLVVVAALAAWDLDAFTRRLVFAAGETEARALAQRHLSHLLALSGAGLLLGGLALSVDLRLTLGGAIVVAGLAVAALTALIAFFRRESD